MSNSEQPGNPARRDFMFGKSATDKEHRIEPKLDFSNFNNQQVNMEKKETPAVLVAEKSTIVSEVDPSSFEPKQMADYLDQLIAHTLKLRKETGLSHIDAKNEMQDYCDTRAKIRLIRNRIKKIKQGTESPDDVSEIKKIWDEMTVSATSFLKRFNETPIGGKHGKDGEPDPAKEKVKAGEKYQAIIDGVLTVVTIKALTDKNLYEVTYQKEGKELPYILSGSELKPFIDGIDPPGTPEFKERLVLRNDWKAQKLNYENEYGKYLASEKNRKEQQTRMGAFAEKFQFWKKENKPESLVLSELQYQKARKEYAGALFQAIGERQGKSSVGKDTETLVANVENIGSAFANRFVLKATHDKAKQEGMFVPEGKRSQLLEGIKSQLSKHSRKIRYGGILATVGIAIVSGGFFAGANALLGKTVSAKFAAMGAVAGSVVGGYVGKAITENRQYLRNRSAKNAQIGFKVDKIDQFEADYFKRYKAHERAAKNEKRYIVGGAVIGGLVGSAVGGNFDVSQALDTSSYDGLGTINEYVTPKDPHEYNTIIKYEEGAVTNYNTSGSLNEYLTPQDPNGYKLVPKLETPPPTPYDGPNTTNKYVIPENFSQFGTIKPDLDTAIVLPPDLPSEDAIETGVAQKPLHNVSPVYEEKLTWEQPIEIDTTTNLNYTFIPGDKINTVSEALCSMLEKNPELIHGDLSVDEALHDFHHEIDHLEHENPDAYYHLLGEMGITSGSIHEVGAGKTYDFKPLFEHLNNLPQ